MKKFTSILESLNPEMKRSLFEKINSLGQWLYQSEGLGLMTIIDKIFKEQNYTQKIGFKQVAKFNKGLDILKKTSMDRDGYIEKQIRYKLPDGIENARLVLDDSGNWDYVNKLNTNYTELAGLISELISRGIENNPEKGQVVYDDVMNDPKEGLLKIKPYLKKLIEFYFIKNGNGLSDFRSFTTHIRKMSNIGENAEDKIVEKLNDHGIDILYQGGNGDFIDMIFGTDIIVHDKISGYKTIQVKNKIIWDKLGHYKVDWVAEGNSLKIFDRITKQEIHFTDNKTLFDTLNKI